MKGKHIYRNLLIIFITTRLFVRHLLTKNMEKIVENMFWTWFFSSAIPGPGVGPSPLYMGYSRKVEGSSFPMVVVSYWISYFIARNFNLKMGFFLDQSLKIVGFTEIRLANLLAWFNDKRNIFMNLLFVESRLIQIDHLGRNFKFHFLCCVNSIYLGKNLVLSFQNFFLMKLGWFLIKIFFGCSHRKLFWCSIDSVFGNKGSTGARDVIIF
jgi:hypothetical protein